MLPTPWNARRSNQSILKISPGRSLEGLMLRLKLQYFGHLMWRVDSLEKTLILGGIWGQEEKGTIEDEMAEWHHQLDAHEFGWTPGVGDGQGGLESCDSWGCKESDTSEWLNWMNWTNDVEKQVFIYGLFKCKLVPPWKKKKKKKPAQQWRPSTAQNNK